MNVIHAFVLSKKENELMRFSSQLLLLQILFDHNVDLRINISSTRKSCRPDFVLSLSSMKLDLR